MKKIILLLTAVIYPLFSYEEKLGFTPTELINTLGAPQNVYTIRGGSPEEDDVLFFYKNSIYAYFNQNRVWQIRLDKNSSETFLGFGSGATEDEIVEILGEPEKIVENSYFYRRPDRGYPVILRLYFENNKLSDLYIYRGDY